MAEGDTKEWIGAVCNKYVYLPKFDYFTNTQIVSCVVEPLIQMSSVSASRLNSTDMATYMVNCIHLIHSTLALYEFTDQRLEMLQAQVNKFLSTPHWNHKINNLIYICLLFGVVYSSTFMRCILQIDAHVDTLVSEQAAFVLNRSNLAELYSAVQQYQPKQGPLSSQPGMDSISIKSSMVRTILNWRDY